MPYGFNRIRWFSMSPRRRRQIQSEWEASAEGQATMTAEKAERKERECAITLGTDAAPPEWQPEAIPAAFSCEHCKREFKSKQAKAAAVRWCKAAGAPCRP